MLFEWLTLVGTYTDQLGTPVILLFIHYILIKESISSADDDEGLVMPSTDVDSAKIH